MGHRSTTRVASGLVVGLAAAASLSACNQVEQARSEGFCGVWANQRPRIVSLAEGAGPGSLSAAAVAARTAAKVAPADLDDVLTTLAAKLDDAASTGTDISPAVVDEAADQVDTYCDAH